MSVLNNQEIKSRAKAERQKQNKINIERALCRKQIKDITGKYVNPMTNADFSISYYEALEKDLARLRLELADAIMDQILRGE